MRYGIAGVFALAVIVAGTMGVGAYAQDGSDSGLSGEIRLGLITPLSGDVAQYGEENLAATNLAVVTLTLILPTRMPAGQLNLR